MLKKISLGILATLLLSASPVLARDVFGNEGLRFDRDSTIEFEFVKSHGAYQSTFGVIDLQTGQKTPLILETKPADTLEPIGKRSTKEDDSAEGVTADFVGTPGNTVPRPIAEFTFKANNRYAFYLESTYEGRPAGILYSLSEQNPQARQRVLFEGGMDTLARGGVRLRWDDTGSLLNRVAGTEDQDFDDFIIRVGGFEACAFDVVKAP